MVSDSRTFLAINPWATIGPALGITALSVSSTLIADTVARHVARELGRTSV
jgi:ABC-type dipeptide/oligopeptide/nickel transport system permease subunit